MPRLGHSDTPLQHDGDSPCHCKDIDKLQDAGDSPCHCKDIHFSRRNKLAPTRQPRLKVGLVVPVVAAADATFCEDLHSFRRKTGTYQAAATPSRPGGASGSCGCCYFLRGLEYLCQHSGKHASSALKEACSASQRATGKVPFTTFSSGRRRGR